MAVATWTGTQPAGATSRKHTHGVTHWRAGCRETGTSGSAGGRTEKDPRTAGTSPYGLPNRVSSKPSLYLMDFRQAKCEYVLPARWAWKAWSLTKPGLPVC